MIQVLNYLYPDAKLLRDYVVSETAESNGPFISEWHLPVEQPTAEYLATVEASPEFAAWQQAKADAKATEESKRAAVATHQAAIEQEAATAIARLEQIIGATTFTNSQLVAAVKHMARYQQRVLKLLARTIEAAAEAKGVR